MNLFKKFIIYMIFLGIFPCFAVFGQNYDAEEQININVYEKINPAIVCIDAQLKEGISSGTGCILTQQGVILTSSHVVDGSNDIDVTTISGKVYKAKVLSILGEKNDIALLKIEPQEPLSTVKLGNSEEIKVGQKVLAIGNPFGFSGTLTQGIVSRIDYTKNKIQTDAAINPGNSGGPLVNTTGEVIGISQSIYNPDNNKSNIGIGFAVPINSVKDLISLKIDKN
ncbi:MAG TPA: trypsin-like peptidase domain-containing protein [Candidatus Gastranaerophilaceae bacterium]|nr:trypsin-like peptidase domain-containing protein [Candidatus Gastranaerophilaceae bacterium]HPT41349.1 trypsin-like peptidase domain-containing protein [Candidatus Gastranaerophilaceae bacterium]